MWQERQFDRLETNKGISFAPCQLDWQERKFGGRLKLVQGRFGSFQSPSTTAAGRVTCEIGSMDAVVIVVFEPCRTRQKICRQGCRGSMTCFRSSDCESMLKSRMTPFSIPLFQSPLFQSPIWRNSLTFLGLFPIGLGFMGFKRGLHRLAHSFTAEVAGNDLTVWSNEPDRGN